MFYTSLSKLLYYFYANLSKLLYFYENYAMFYIILCNKIFLQNSVFLTHPINYHTPKLTNQFNAVNYMPFNSIVAT